MTIKHSVTATGTNDGTKQVSVTGWNADHVITEFLDLPERPDVPAVPTSGIRLYAHNMAGRRFLDYVGPSGLDLSLQPAFFNSTIAMFVPASGSVLPAGFGTGFTALTSGTGAAITSGTRATTNGLTSMSRMNLGTGTTATGTYGFRSTDPMAWRGNAAGLGGFFFAARIGVETYLASMRIMVGLSANTATLAADPSTLANTVALVKDSADTNWFIATRDATTLTKTATGIAVTAGQVLDFMAYAPSNGSSITVAIFDAVAGTQPLANTAISANLPVSTTFLYMQAHAMSTAGTTAKTLSVNRMYVETDL